MERHLIDVLWKCLSQTSQRHLLRCPQYGFFQISRKKTFPITFVYLFLAFLSKCLILIFGHKAVTTLGLRRCCSEKKLTLLRRFVFDIGFLTKYLNVAAMSCFWSCFPDKNLMAYQYHYNCLFPKNIKVVLQFHLFIKKIYFVSVNAKRSLNLVYIWKFTVHRLNSEKEILILSCSLIRNSFLCSCSKFSRFVI